MAQPLTTLQWSQDSPHGLAPDPAAFSTTDAEACPHCGVAPAPFDVRASGLLDMCLLMQSLLLDLRREVEAMLWGDGRAALQDDGAHE